MTNPKYLRPGFDFALAHFIEECGEALAAAGKTQRWGRYSVNPELPEAEQETNENWLFTGVIWQQVLTFGSPLQPQLLTAKKPEMKASEPRP